MSNGERRGHLRYRDPDAGTWQLVIPGEASGRLITALPVNESYGGLACVYVGPAVAVDTEVLWQETEDIGTPCRVMRCEALHPDVQLLALRIVE